MAKVIKRPHLQAALAVAEFAQRWDRQLWRMAKKVKCQCAPPHAGDDESDHGPDCPVGLMRQAGRLMCEEASDVVNAEKTVDADTLQALSN